MLLRNLAGCCLAVVLGAPPAAQAALKPAAPIAASEFRLAAMACSFGYHLDVSGFCVDSMDYSRKCPPGYFAQSFPNGNGFRCIPAEWMRSSGWLGDFFH